MATQAEFDQLKAGFLILEEAVRTAAFSLSNGFAYSGPLAEVLDDVNPLGTAERETLDRALQVI